METDGGAACGLEFDEPHLTGPELNRAKFGVLGAPGVAQRAASTREHARGGRVCGHAVNY